MAFRKVLTGVSYMLLLLISVEFAIKAVGILTTRLIVVPKVHWSFRTRPGREDSV